MEPRMSVCHTLSFCVSKMSNLDNNFVYTWSLLFEKPKLYSRVSKTNLLSATKKCTAQNPTESGLEYFRITWFPLFSRAFNFRAIIFVHPKNYTFRALLIFAHPKILLFRAPYLIFITSCGE